MSAGSPLSLRTACSTERTPRSRTHVPSRSVGSGRVAQLADVGTGVGESEHHLVVGQQTPHAVRLVVGDVDAEPGAEVLFHGQAADDVERVAAPLPGHGVDPPALQLGMEIGLGHLAGLPPGSHRLLGQVGGGPGPPLGVGIGGEPGVPVLVHELGDYRAHVEAERAVHGELHGEGPGGHLGPDLETPGDGLVLHVELGLVAAVGEGEHRVGEWPADARLQLVHVGVGALLARRGQHDALVGAARRQEQRLHLVPLGEPAGYRQPVHPPVGVGEAGREPGGPGARWPRPRSGTSRSISSGVAARS